MHAKNQLQVENNVSTQWPGLIIKGVSIMSKRVLSKMATRISVSKCLYSTMELISLAALRRPYAFAQAFVVAQLTAPVETPRK